GVLVDPDLLVLESNRVDHQRVAFPPPQFLAKERRRGIVRVLALGIDGDQAKVAVPVQERDLVGALKNLERQTAGVVPRNAAENAEAFGIDCRCQIVCECGFAGRRQWQLPPGKILADVATGLRVTRALPVATRSAETQAQT